MKTDEWQKVLDVNLNGPFYLTRILLKDMIKTKMVELLIFLLFQVPMA